MCGIAAILSTSFPAIPLAAALKRMTTASLPHLTVLSFNEVTRDTQVESVALVSMPPMPNQATTT
jgi:flagellar biosynthesis component FlhA